MFIYFRKVKKEKSDDRQRWISEAEKSLEGQKTSAEGSIKIDERVLSDSAQLFYIEKGDDLYGVISYTIAQFAVVKHTNEAGEIVIIPSGDEEWDEAAKTEFYKMIAGGGLDQTGYQKFEIRLSNDCDSEIARIEGLGYERAAEEMDRIVIATIRKENKEGLWEGIFRDENQKQ